MIPTFTWLGVIGLVLTIAIYIIQWRIGKNAAKLKAQEDEDKKIDAVTDADSTLRELSRLSDESPANRD